MLVLIVLVVLLVSVGSVSSDCYLVIVGVLVMLVMFNVGSDTMIIQ